MAGLGYTKLYEDKNIYHNIAVAALGIVSGTQASHSDDQYSFVANVVSALRTGSKPIPTEVTWVESEAVEDGDVILDHFEVVLEDETDVEIGRIEASTSDRSVVLSKTNLPDMKVFTTYQVHVDEYYTDGSSEEGFDYAFSTAPPKLKKVRVKNKTLETDGDVSILLKWRQPVNLKGEYVYYDYKIVKTNTKKSLVYEDYAWGDINSATIGNLPARKLQIRVRARTDNNGSGQWSAWKKFSAPIE